MKGAQEKKQSNTNRILKVAIILLACILLTMLVLCIIYAAYVHAREPDGVVVIQASDTGTDFQPIETTLGLFKSSYENENGWVTVSSSQKQMIIAPGTSGSFWFYIKNETDMAVDYTTTLSIVVNNTPDDIQLPFKVRMSDENGVWLWGDANNFEDLAKLQSLYKKANLGKECYNILKLEWEWPFEGDDERDTILGNLAASGETATYNGPSVDLKMDILATSAPSADKFGDLSSKEIQQIILPLAFVAIGLLILAVLLIIYFRNKPQKQSENEQLQQTDEDAAEK